MPTREQLFSNPRFQALAPAEQARVLDELDKRGPTGPAPGGGAAAAAPADPQPWRRELSPEQNADYQSFLSQYDPDEQEKGTQDYVRNQISTGNFVMDQQGRPHLASKLPAGQEEGLGYSLPRMGVAAATRALGILERPAHTAGKYAESGLERIGVPERAARLIGKYGVEGTIAGAPYALPLAFVGGPVGTILSKVPMVGRAVAPILEAAEGAGVQGVLARTARAGIEGAALQPGIGTAERYAAGQPTRPADIARDVESGLAWAPAHAAFYEAPRGAGIALRSLRSPAAEGAPVQEPIPQAAAGTTNADESALGDAVIENASRNTKEQPQTKGPAPTEPLPRTGYTPPGMPEATPEERAQYEDALLQGRGEYGGTGFELSPEQRAARALIPPRGPFVGPRQQPTRPFATLPGEGRAVLQTGPGADSTPFEVAVGDNPLSRGGRAERTWLDQRNATVARMSQAERALVPQGERGVTVAPTPALASATGEFPMTPRRLDAIARAQRALGGQPTSPNVIQLGQAFETERTGGGRNTLDELQRQLRSDAEARDRANQVGPAALNVTGGTPGVVPPGVAPHPESGAPAAPVTPAGTTTFPGGRPPLPGPAGRVPPSEPFATRMAPARGALPAPSGRMYPATGGAGAVETGPFGRGAPEEELPPGAAPPGPSEPVGGTRPLPPAPTTQGQGDLGSRAAVDELDDTALLDRLAPNTHDERLWRDLLRKGMSDQDFSDAVEEASGSRPAPEVIPRLRRVLTMEDPERTSYAPHELTYAVMDHDDLVHADTRATNHNEVLEAAGLKPDDVQSTGFMFGGDYKPGTPVWKDDRVVDIKPPEESHEPLGTAERLKQQEQQRAPAPTGSLEERVRAHTGGKLDKASIDSTYEYLEEQFDNPDLSPTAHEQISNALADIQDFEREVQRGHRKYEEAEKPKEEEKPEKPQFPSKYYRGHEILRGYGGEGYSVYGPGEAGKLGPKLGTAPTHEGAQRLIDQIVEPKRTAEEAAAAAPERRAVELLAAKYGEGEQGWTSADLQYEQRLASPNEGEKPTQDYLDYVKLRDAVNEKRITPPGGTGTRLPPTEQARAQARAPEEPEEQKPAVPAPAAAPAPTKLAAEDRLVRMPAAQRRLFARIRPSPEDIEKEQIAGSTVFDVLGKNWPAKMEKAGYWDRDTDRVTPQFLEDFKRWSDLRNEPVEHTYNPETQQKTPIRYDPVEDTRPGKRGFGAVQQMASEDPTRFNLAGVYVDPKGYLVATNGHYLIAAPAKPRGLVADKIYDDAGKTIEGQFPDWRQVVPKDLELIGHSTAAELEALGKTPKDMAPGENRKRVVAIETPQGPMYADAGYVEQIGKSMRQLGVERVRLEMTRKPEEGEAETKSNPLNGPITITEADPPKGQEPVVAIQMPIRGPEEGKPFPAYDFVRWTPAAAKGRKGGGGGEGGGTLPAPTTAPKVGPEAPPVTRMQTPFHDAFDLVEHKKVGPEGNQGDRMTWRGKGKWEGWEIVTEPKTKFDPSAVGFAMPANQRLKGLSKRQSERYSLGNPENWFIDVKVKKAGPDAQLGMGAAEAAGELEKLIDKMGDDRPAIVRLPYAPISESRARFGEASFQKSPEEIEAKAARMPDRVKDMSLDELQKAVESVVGGKQHTDEATIRQAVKQLNDQAEDLARGKYEEQRKRARKGYGAAVPDMADIRRTIRTLARFADEVKAGNLEWGPGVEPPTAEQKFAPEDHPVSREQLREAHYITPRKYSDLHKHGYNIVVWRTAKGTPEQAHWVYEYVPREPGSTLPRLTANADDKAAIEKIEQSVGYDREATREEKNPFLVGDRVKVRGLGQGHVERSWKSGKVSVKLDDGRTFERQAKSGDIRPVEAGAAPKPAGRSVSDVITDMRDALQREKGRLDEAFDDAEVPAGLRGAVEKHLDATARRYYGEKLGRGLTTENPWRWMDNHLNLEERREFLDEALPSAPRAGGTEVDRPSAAQVMVFRSGANRPADIQGYLRAGRAPGFVIGELKGAARKVAVDAAIDGRPMLVDSGALPAFNAGKQLTDADFTHVMTQYNLLLHAAERRANIRRLSDPLTPEPERFNNAFHLVMPDVVGDQAETARVQELFAPEMRDLYDQGATLVVPLQRGERSLADEYRRVDDLLEDERGWIPAIPGNKKAVPEDELLQFVKEAKPEAIHLLGIGNETELARLRQEINKAAGYDVQVTADATKLRSQTERIAKAQAEEREKLVGPEASPVDVYGARRESRARAIARIEEEGRTVPTPDEVLRDNPGAKKSGRIYDSSTPPSSGEYPEGTAERQATNISRALFSASETRRRAEEAGDDAEVRRAESAYDAIAGTYREGTKTMREELAKRHLLPTPGVEERTPKSWSGMVKAWLTSAQDRFKKHLQYRRVVDEAKAAITKGHELHRMFVTRSPQYDAKGNVVPGTGGWDAVWQTVSRDKDKTQYGALEKALIQSELEDKYHTPDELKALGLNDNTIKGYRQLHHLFRVALEQVINPLRKRLGLPAIKGIQGFYFPHKWLGTYEIMTNDGIRVESPEGRASFATLYDARKVAREFKRENPTTEIAISQRRQDIPDNVTAAGESAAIRKLFDAADAKDAELLGRLEEGLAAERTRRGFIRHLEHRIGATGYEKGKLAEVGRMYFNQLSGYAPRKLAMERITNILREVDESRDPQLHEDMQAFLRDFGGQQNMIEQQVDRAIMRIPFFRLFLDPRRPTRELTGHIREFTAHAKIGMLNPAFFAMNLTQPLTHTIPITGGRSFMAGVRSLFAPTAEEINWIRLAEKKGLLEPRYTEAPTPAGRGPYWHRLDEVKKLSFLLGRMSEKWNRQITLVAALDRLRREGAKDRIVKFAYDMAKQPRVQVGDDWVPFNPEDRRHILDFLGRVIDRTQFRYDVTDRARFMRGALGMTAAQFRSYVTNTFGMQGRFYDLAKEGDLSPLLYHMGAAIALAGVAGIPGLDMIDSVIEKLTGYSPQDEFNKYVWKQQAKGGKAATAASVAKGGLPALVNLDARRRIGQADFAPSRWRDLVPPAANMAFGLAQDYLTNGFADAMRGAFPMAKWLSNVQQHAAGTVKDRYGRVLYTEPAWGDIHGPSYGQIAGILAGLPETRQSETWEKLKAARGMKEQLIRQKRDLFNAIIDAQDAKDSDKVRSLVKQAQAAGFEVTTSTLDKFRKGRKTPSELRTIQETPKVLRPQLQQWMTPEQLQGASRALGGK